MSLAGIKVKNVRRRKPTAKAVPLATYLIEPEPTDLLSLVDGAEPLSRVPNLEPFLKPSLIPDLVDMYRWAGVKALIEQVDLVDENKSRQDLVDELALLWSSHGLNMLLERIRPMSYGLDIEKILDEGGILGLSQVVELADPNNPESIIFVHPTQEENIQTQKVEIDMIMDNPLDVEERTDIQCACGGRRIKTATKQTRSSDEAPDVFAYCVECKKRWRFRA